MYLKCNFFKTIKHKKMSTSKQVTDKKGNYSQPGIHPEDRVTPSGQKDKFDRGDPDEDKTDIIQEKDNTKKSVTEVPIEYSTPGIQSGDQIDASGHKKKYDRAAPEESGVTPVQQISKISEETEVSEPNYVAKEHIRHQEAIKQGIAGLSEREFLENLIAKASAGGWSSPVISELKHRLDTLWVQSRN